MSALRSPGFGWGRYNGLAHQRVRPNLNYNPNFNRITLMRIVINTDNMKKYKCIVNINIGWATDVEAEYESEAKKIARELAWDNMFYHPRADVSTNDVECDDATEITE